jgi:hypothetical protein
MQKKCFTIQSNKNSKYKIVIDYRNGNPQIYNVAMLDWFGKLDNCYDQSVSLNFVMLG